ncbi:MAG: hybrid sensor histidine kinase/response regulator [Motiliproteus sp.]
MANEPINLQGYKVLIVDDMPTNLDVLNRILEEQGYKVSFATSGEQAIKLATLDRPDLILLDVMMPEMDGFETCRRLKSLRQTRSIPVIFVTGKTDSQDVVEGFHIGAVDYITKPVCQEEVCARTQAHLQTQALLQIRDELIEKLREHNQSNLQALAEQRKQLVGNNLLASLGEMVGEFAHEVGTPVGVSLTALSNLVQENRELQGKFADGTLTRQDFSDYLSISQESNSLAVSNIERAVKLIQSFRRVVVDQCQEETSKFKLKEYIEQVLLTLSPKLKNTDHKVEVDCPEDLEIDSYPGAFAGIVTNLVINSLIHGFKDKSAGLMRFQVQAGENGLNMTYSDDGCGIPEEFLERVFDKYFTSNREGGGSGLGLHVIQCLVADTLGGEIECQSQQGQGVQFNIRVPLTIPLAHDG